MANSKIEVGVKVSASKQAIGGKTPEQGGGNTASKNDLKKGIGGDFTKVSKDLGKSMSDLARKFTDGTAKLIKSNTELTKDLKNLKSSIEKMKANIGHAVANPGTTMYSGAKGMGSAIATSIPILGAIAGGLIYKTLDLASNYRQEISNQAGTIGIAGFQRSGITNAFNNVGYGEFLKSARISSGNSSLLYGEGAGSYERVSNYKLKYGVGDSELGKLVGVAGGLGGFGKLMDTANQLGNSTQIELFMQAMTDSLSEAVKDGMDQSTVAKIGDDFGQTVSRIALVSKNSTVDLAMKIAKSMQAVRGRVAQGDISDPLSYMYAKESRRMLSSVDQGTIDFLQSQGVWDLSGVKAGQDLTQSFDARDIGGMIKAIQSSRGKELDQAVFGNFYESSKDQSGKANFGKFQGYLEQFTDMKDFNSARDLFNLMGKTPAEIEQGLADRKKIGESMEEGSSDLGRLRQVNSLSNSESIRKTGELAEKALTVASELEESLNELTEALGGADGVKTAIKMVGEGANAVVDGIKNIITAMDKFSLPSWMGGGSKPKEVNTPGK